MRQYCITGIIYLFLLGMMPGGNMGSVHAKEAVAYFGTSDGYTWDAGEVSHIGFYLESSTNEDLEYVRFLVEYDPKVLELSSSQDEGITVVEEGKFVLERSGDLGPVFKQILYFKPLVSAHTGIEILSAEAETSSGPIRTETEVYTEIDIPVEPGCRLTGLFVDGVEIEGFHPDTMSYEISSAGEKEPPVISVETADGTEAAISDDELVVGRNTIYITTTNRQGQKALYTIYMDRAAEPLAGEAVAREGSKEIPDSADSAGQENQPVQGDGNAAEHGREAALASPESEIDATSSKEDRTSRKRALADRILKGMVIVICVLAGSEIVLLLYRTVSNKNKGPKAEPPRDVTKKRTKKNVSSTMPPVVIQADHVCMDFDRAVNEYSSVKELIIQTVKGERIKEKYRALDDISFSIRKGKVIGVIGTNGAGKSTLLKIISGALRPTNGTMRVNRNKIQILTLGTGFDMELTGKENVYLNGAIIGYEKQFIDEHYEEIVEFAELQDFMGEKVKNYSSGMVSRLGFAIATVGQPPEILILDEVLSVGDQIFRKKSLKRIKELIHSGSTVIMVSHSIGTIRENCDSVFWLEKGHMIAMGDTKEVCDMYERYDGNFEKLMNERESEFCALEWIV